MSLSCDRVGIDTGGMASWKAPIQKRWGEHEEVGERIILVTLLSLWPGRVKSQLWLVAGKIKL